MGDCPPYLFETDAAAVSVETDVEGAVTIVAIRGIWDRPLWRRASTSIRKCLAEHGAAVIVDLSALVDPAAESAPTWITAQSIAAGMQPPVQMALCVPPELILADRLQELGVRRFLPVYAKIRQARVALASRLPLTDRLSLRLTPDPDAPSLARDMVGDACRAWALPQLLYPARLVLSELVSNAVEHAGTDLIIVLSRRGAGLHMAVFDGDRRIPQLRRLAPPHPGLPLDERGRGLRTVHATATVWGAMPTPDGKVVWATVRTAEGNRRMPA
jgi:anti-sigma regulatory factor (Ser/Thr protein kinase)